MTDPRPCPGHDCAAVLRESEFLCGRCVHRADRILGDLVAETHELETTITRQARISTGGHRKKGDEQPLPVNLKAAHDGDNALMLLFEWADFIAQRHKQPGMPVRTTGVDKRVQMVTQAVGIIHRHIAWLGADEQGPECASAIWHVRRNLRRIFDRPADRWYAGPCETKGVVTVDIDDYDTITANIAGICQAQLYAEPGKLQIKCDGWHQDDHDGCGTVHTFEQRRVWLIEYMQGALVTIDDTLAVLPTLFPDYPKPRRDSITGWVRSGRLQAQGANHVGEPTFVGIELLDLIKAYKPHTFSPRRKRATA